MKLDEYVKANEAIYNRIKKEYKTIVSNYITSDGNKFNNFSAAVDHEKELSSEE